MKFCRCVACIVVLKPILSSVSPYGALRRLVPSGITPSIARRARWNRSLVGMNDVRDPQNALDDRPTSTSRDPVERPVAVNETWTAGKDTTFAYDIAGNVVTRRTDGIWNGSAFPGGFVPDPPRGW